MTGFGTDVVALACILGSAATSGAVTMALMGGEEEAPAPCAVETLSLRPNVVLSHGDGAHAIVMTTPHLQLHSAQAHDCKVALREAVRVDVKVMKRQMEEARVRIEEARLEAEEARHAAREARILEREVRMSKEEVRKRVEAAQAEVEANLVRIREARQEALIRQQEEAVRRLEAATKKGSGGRLE